MLRPLIDFCVQAAPAGAGRHAGRRGVRRQGLPGDAGRGVPRRHQRAGAASSRSCPGWRPRRSSGRSRCRSSASSTARPGMILMRSESLFGLSLVDAHVRRRRRLVQVARDRERAAGRGRPAGRRRTLKLAPEATPLGEIYQFRVVSDRHTLTETRAELEWTVSRHPPPGARRRRRRDASAATSRRSTSRSIRRACSRTTSRWPTSPTRSSKSNRNVGGGFLQHGDQQLAIRGVGLPADAAGRAGDRAQERRRHAGHGRRRVAGRGCRTRRGAARSATTSTRDVAEGFVLLRRGENPSVVLDGVHEKVAELNDKHPAEGHADRAVLRPHDAGRRDARHGPPQPAVRRAAGHRRWSGCSCAASAAR